MGGQKQLKKENKIDLTHDIFKWAREFSKTDLYDKLTKLSSPYWNIEKGVFVYGCTQWGHRTKHIEDNGVGCWARFYLEPKGFLFYVAGYASAYCPKWPPIDAEFRMRSPNDLAKKFRYGYLLGFMEKIESKQIYNSIKEWIEPDSKLVDMLSRKANRYDPTI